MNDRRPIVLWGPPAAGKSTLARALARALTRPCVDTDDEIARSEGAPVATVFARAREAGFRRIEAAVVREALARGDGPVVSLGGGALLDPALRRFALDRAMVLTLAASPRTLFERVAREPDARPLLHGADEARVEALLAQRRDAYLEAHAIVDAHGAPEAVLSRALQAIDECERERTVVVGLGARTYRVSFAGLDTLAPRVRALGPSATIAVTDENVLRAPGVASAMAAIAPAGTVRFRGEGDLEKTLEGASRVWDEALSVGVDRRAVIVAVGGGAVSDLAGFAAANLLRGVRFVAAPTTVLSIADASVGGKTAVDHPRGKNLVGAFHQPSLVLCDVRALETLSLRERRSGLAEVVKVAAIADAGLLDTLERLAEPLSRGDLDALSTVLPDAVRAKARVVAEDEREDGARASLNFGHTLGHAIEHGAGYALPHGECVALGMRCALALGAQLGLPDADAIALRINGLLDRLGLPSALPPALDRASLEAALTRDKKRDGDGVRFVLCTRPGAFESRRVPWASALASISALKSQGM